MTGEDIVDASRPSRFIRLMLYGATVIVAVFAIAAVFPKARLFALWAVGRGGGCPCGAVIRSHELLLDMNSAAERIGASSRVLQRDPAGLELLDTSAGRYWTVKNDKFLHQALAEESVSVYGEQEHGVKPGDVVLDCGANVGAFTRKAVSAGARLVVAIEPTPVSVECLRRNFQREIAEGRVIVYPKGVWDRVDTLELAVGEEGNITGNSFIFGRGSQNKIRLPLTTIDLLASELHLDHIDFIKMDIEGAEKQALRGAVGVIREFQPRLAIACEHLPDDLTAIPKTVADISPRYSVQPSGCRDAFSEVRAEALLFQAR